MGLDAITVLHTKKKLSVALKHKEFAVKHIFGAALLLFSCAVLALPEQGQNPIHTLRVTVLADAYACSMNAGTAAGVNDASRAEQNLKELVPAAISAAQGNAGLTAAIKAFYIAAKTYFDSAFTPVPLPSYDVRFGSQPSPESIQLKATQATLKAYLDSKANALQLEAQLAGMEPN